jgi:adenine/guanine/hypoxanthine permease
LGVTPGVALAYGVVAVGFFAVEKFGISTVILSYPEMPLAAPAE